MGLAGDIGDSIMAANIYSYGASYVTLADKGSRKYQLGNSMQQVYDVAAGSIGLATYVNSVWDTQKSGDDKTHYWRTSPDPDPNGTYYDGPGTWGVHTSGFSALPIGVQAEEEVNYHTESNLWTPPETPHALDDEFDLSVLGSEWYCYSQTSDAYGTISANTVDAYDSTFNSGDALRVTVNNDLRRSWALLQAPVSRALFLGKTFSAPTNVLVMSRIKFNQYQAAAVASDRNIVLFLLADSAGDPDIDNRVNLALNLQEANVVRASLYKTESGTPSGYTYSTDVDAQGQALEYVAIHKIGTTFHGYVGTASGNWIWMGSQSFSTSIGHIGFSCYSTSTDKPAVAVYGIDFIRFKETDNFLL